MKSKKNLLLNCLLVIISIAIPVAIAEAFLGTYFPVKFKQDEKNTAYQFDQEFGWFGRSNIDVEYSKKHTYREDGPVINIKNNSEGFRDDEFTASTKPAIVFIGDSFVWGYEVNKEQRFTEKLRKRINDYSIYNLGVSGYGTDQEYLLLKKYFNKFNPKIVFLIFCSANDRLDNTTNFRYGSYFKPYFTIDKNDELQLEGIPIPKSPGFYMKSFYSKLNIKLLTKSQILSNILRIMERQSFHDVIMVPDPTNKIMERMNSFVKQNGAEFIVGLTNTDVALEAFLKEKNIAYLDLSNQYRFPRHGHHWTNQGHDFVTDKIEQFLVSGNY